jgi:predicted P-loop ATPase
MTLLEHARAYAARGWPVLPLHAIAGGRCTCGRPSGKGPDECGSPGKHPRTARGLTEASTDVDDLDQWWGRWPSASIAIRTGPAPAGAGIWVLDLDAGTDAHARVNAAAVVAGDPAGSTWATLTARTGGGGLHAIFRLSPADVALLGELGLTLPTRNGIGGKGLDVRADGGYIVAPPSVHESGRSYAWQEQRDVIPAPRWLLQLVGKPLEQRKSYTPPPRREAAPEDSRRKFGEAVLRNACAKVAAASDGTRHAELLRQAKTVGGYIVSAAIPYPAALDALCTAGESTGKGPKECRRTTIDGLTYGMERPLEVPEREHAGAGAGPAPGGAGEQQPGAGEQQGPSQSESRSSRLDEARALLARCLGVLYGEAVTRAERQAVARELAGCVDLLADLAIAHPDEWATWCAAAGAAGGFGEQLKELRRAVTAAVTAWTNAKRKATQDKRAEQADAARARILERLSTNERGRPSGSYANIVTIFKGDPRWSTLRMSALGNVVEVEKEELLEGPATADACEWLRDSYGMDAGEVSVKSAIYAVAQGRLYSPVKEYLESVRPLAKHGGTETIARLLPEALGIEDATDLQRAMMGRFLVSAVARAMKPGCKVDTALVLVGAQGAKKSTFFKTLFGAYFGDSPIPIGNKDAPIQLSRTWGYEAAELEDLTSKRTAEAVKQFLGTASDLYRPPFARAAVQVPRHTVLCGSSNPSAILTDSTGSRRFWILPLSDTWVVPVPLLLSMRDRVWSEALALYGDGSGDGVNGERWWFDRSEDRVREEDAQQYQIADDWQPLVERWLKTSPEGAFMLPPEAEGNFTRTAVLVGLGLNVNQIDQKASRRVAAILTRLGWVELNSPAGFRGSRVWRKA